MSCHDHRHESDGGPAEGSERRSRKLNIIGSSRAPRQWRSEGELAQTQDYLRGAVREFPVGASELPTDSVSRRGFVQLLGASLALTTTACYRPQQKIVPYVRRPPEINPGNSLHYTTAYPLEGFGLGYLVESHIGRPTKIEGNPDHPDSLGATRAVDQAVVLGLYDDTRARQLRHEGTFLAWREMLGALGKHAETLAADGGAKLRFLVEPNASPLLADLRGRVLQRFPKAKFVSYSSIEATGATEGAALAFGRPLEASHDVSKADVILSLDSDFLEEGPEMVRLSRQFGKRREPGPDMNRLYVVEPSLTATGMMADHRLRVRGSDVVAFAQALAAELGKGGASLGAAASLPAPSAQVDARFVAAVAKDLLRARGRSVVIAGRRQPAAVHALANLINHALGNVGTTVVFRAPLRGEVVGPQQLAGLAEEIAAGQVDTLVITAWNPVYAAPADLKLRKLIERVPHSIYLGLHEDETAAATKSMVPAAHVLESWGDARGTDGTVSLVQPLISPLWSGITEADLLSAFVGLGDQGAYNLLKAFWRTRALAEKWATAADFDQVWESWLAKGVIANTAAAPETNVNPSASAEALSGAIAAAAPKGDGLELAFEVDSKVWDGRFANNVWLQELPDPVTKITWDNAVLMSRSTAAKLGVKTTDVVTVDFGGNTIKGPVYVQPGHADDAVTVRLGYGRKGAELYGAGVGFNANELRTSGSPWFARGANVQRVGGNYRFGITEDHWAMVHDKDEAIATREPAMVGTLKEFGDHKSEFVEKIEERRRTSSPSNQGPHGPHGKPEGHGESSAHVLPTIHEPVNYQDQAYKWAMSIDLGKCTGCSACVVACQSENNIPTVGRDNVRIGREMQWIRIDRYFEGDMDNPELAVSQPVMCVHCETAPCEYVCPVNATVHSDEGLNEMVYNRCIGTRYCSNNCPYKARRFNFLDWTGDTTPVQAMKNNPDVTVRSRGVMEKCTYCVQRIERARIDSRVEGRMIADGELQTACQQVCPTGAIVFGSLNDPHAAVTKQHADARRYDLLNELNTRPRTAYLARIRNPNPEL